MVVLIIHREPYNDRLMRFLQRNSLDWLWDRLSGVMISSIHHSLLRCRQIVFIGLSSLINPPTCGPLVILSLIVVVSTADVPPETSTKAVEAQTPDECSNDENCRCHFILFMTLLLT